MWLGYFGLICWMAMSTEIASLLFYVNVSGMRPWSRRSSQPLMIPVPWVILRVGGSIPVVSTLVIASHFLVWNREAELKTTTFSSLLLFRVFLFSLFF